MKSLVWATSLSLVLSLVPSLAQADEPSLTQQVEQRVKTGLLQPLVAQDANQPRFSRMRPPPRERRVRVTQSVATLDKSGQPFVPFAIDSKWGSDWQENDIVGCEYPKTGALFVKIGSEYRSADFLLGKAADPVPGVCQKG